MEIVRAIKCNGCESVIFSRARHDFHKCECGDVSIDGGFSYVKIGGSNWGGKVYGVEVPETKDELFQDWNREIDKFGFVSKEDAEEFLKDAKVNDLGEEKEDE